MTLGKHPFITLFSALLAFAGATSAHAAAPAADDQPEAVERPPVYFNFIELVLRVTLPAALPRARARVSPPADR